MTRATRTGARCITISRVEISPCYVAMIVGDVYQPPNPYPHPANTLFFWLHLIHSLRMLTTFYPPKSCRLFKHIRALHALDTLQCTDIDLSLSQMYYGLAGSRDRWWVTPLSYTRNSSTVLPTNHPPPTHPTNLPTDQPTNQPKQ